jgi:hypothetical protein
MVELGLKLEDFLKQKGLENNVTRAHSFDNLSENERLPLQNSAKVTDHIRELPPKNNQVDTRKEIANFANTSHDTVMKVKKIKVKAPEEVKQKLRSGEMSINQAYTTIKKQEKTRFLKIEAPRSVYGSFSGSWLDFHLI